MRSTLAASSTSGSYSSSANSPILCRVGISPSVLATPSPMTSTVRERSRLPIGSAMPATSTKCSS